MTDRFELGAPVPPVKTTLTEQWDYVSTVTVGVVLPLVKTKKFRILGKKLSVTGTEILDSQTVTVSVTCDCE